jgi:hypothetical protein
MGLRGPEKEYPRSVRVGLTDEQYDYIGDLAALMQAPHSAVLRAMVEAEMNESAARIQEYRREEAKG